MDATRMDATRGASGAAGSGRPTAADAFASRADGGAVPALAARALTVRLGQRTVLRDVDLALQPGWTAIVGPNGAGKSTLLKTLAGLLAPSTGEVQLAGRRLSDWSPYERARRLAWLPQGGGTTGELTVRETVALGRIVHLGLAGVAGPQDHSQVDEAMRAVDCLEWQHRRLAGLSGGERQRVLLARALATEAPLLLLDEPTTHLDPPHQVALADLLRRWARAETGGPLKRHVITVLHDLPVALRADHLWVMQAGRLVACSETADPGVHRALETAFEGAVSISPDAGAGWRVDLALPR